MNGFDILAPFYDKAARLIYGKSILNASIEFFDYIKPNDKILILGGGTGEILEYMNIEGITIYYVEMSQEMISRAKKRTFTSTVIFTCGSYTDIPDIKFDVVIMPFFLDLFTTETAKRIVDKIKYREQGYFIFADFTQPNAYWQRLILNFMYLFFRMTCHIEGKTLPDFTFIFKDYNLLEERGFFRGMIRSKVYSPIK